MSLITIIFFQNYKSPSLLYPLFLLLATIFFPGTAVTSDQIFPNYRVISSNVAFWEKIYSHYSLTEAVIHDSNDLSKIYEVIPILGEDLPGSARINSLFEQQVKDKYRAILTSLAGRRPSTSEERRVAALFSGQNSARQFLIAAENVRSQKGQKERFLAGVINSGSYMQEIKRIIRAYNLPEELAYLPHVESSFNYRAYSRVGAAGIWQFTKGTGSEYLRIDYTIDERLDPILATHAAAKYLKNSYRSLNNWPLALTSYNYGLAGIHRAVNEQGSYENIFIHYNKGHFKFASRNFYPSFLAAIKVAKQLEADRNVKLASAQSTRYLKLPGYVHIKDISNHFGISQDTLKSLNPALRASVISGEKRIPKGSVIRLPAGKKTNQLLASIPPSFYSRDQNPSLFHRVQKGDTLSSIARHHGVSLKSLMTANNLDQYATIYLKQKLRIPHKGAAVAKTKKNVPKIIAPGKAKTITSVHDPTIPIFLATKKRHPSGNGYDYLPIKDPTIYNVFNIHQKNNKIYGYITIQPEESLGLYKNWLNTTTTAILALNKLSPQATVTPGQQLLLVFDQLPPTRFEEKRLDFLKETEEDFFSAFTVIGQKRYRVISGDTLWDLCYNKFDIPLWLLERYNSTINLTRLSNNQELIIPIVQQI